MVIYGSFGSKNVIICSSGRQHIGVTYQRRVSVLCCSFSQIVFGENEFLHTLPKPAAFLGLK